MFRLARECNPGTCDVSDYHIIYYRGKLTTGPKTKVGLIVESEKLGFSISTKSQAAFSANALLAAGLSEFYASLLSYEP